ncbi:MAG TPA: DUF3854 domain-containing protein [Planctomycetaceae bacterium]|nr:DUF3854 domain-containing protein [Planctomycetaceae bacterium]
MKPDWTRASPRNPCPVCGKSSWCCWPTDGDVIQCSRVSEGALSSKLNKNGEPYWIHSVAAGNAPTPPRHAPTPEDTTQLAPPELLYNVYSALIAALRLNPRHRRDLERRGLTAHQIDIGEYRSLPQGDRPGTAREVALRFADGDLARVPGFVRRQDGSWELRGASGLLIPVRNLEAQIIAIKIRRDNSDNGPKYCYMSSKSHGGPGPGSPAHVPLFARDLETTMVRVTEGELKADIVTALSGIPAVSAPGVAGWRSVPPLLRELNVKSVELAFDADFRSNKAVKRHLRAAASGIAAEGIEVRALIWEPPVGKGLDDVLVSGGTTKLVGLDHELFESADEDHTHEPCQEGLTDTGNAERLVRIHGSVFRYCSAWKKWIVWDGERWRHDDERVLALTKSVAKNLFTEGALMPPSDLRDNTLRWAKASEAATRRQAMMALARAEHGVAVEHDALDSHPWLLTVKNGTIDLQSGKLLSHRREHLITKLAPVRFDETAECPTWMKFIEVVLPDKDVRQFIQRAVGWTLTGDVSSQALLFLHGGGANGKSTFLVVLQRILGRDLAIQTAPDLLLSTGSRHPTELADLFGVRMAVCTEMGGERRFNETLIKQLTGGDIISARRMREDFWRFEPTHKLWLAANHKPEIRGTDMAIWRRIMLIPFTVTIPEKERDPKLTLKLRAEASGILNWALEGCAAWQQQGLNAPDAVRAATKEYRGEMDVVGRFLDERCRLIDGPRIGATTLFESLEKWCKSTGEACPSQREFGRTMTERGFQRKKSGGTYHYLNIGLMIDPISVRDEEGPCGPNSGRNPYDNSHVESKADPGPHRPPSSPAARGSSSSVDENAPFPLNPEDKF